MLRKGLPFLFLLVFGLFQRVFGEDPIILYTSDHQDSLSRTIKAIPEHGGDVKILIDAPLTGEEDSYLMALQYRDIASLTIGTKVPVVIDNILELYAWGIPLTIGENIDLRNCSIYGGGAAQTGESLSFDQTDITLNGSAAFVFGGGFADGGGECTVDSGSVHTGADSTVYYEIFGGGFAHGSGSVSVTRSARVYVSGESDYVLGGGFAEAGGTALGEEAEIVLGEGAIVNIALFGGCSAAGSESTAKIGEGITLVNGYAHWAFGGDFAYDGGKTMTDRLQKLTVGSNGHCASLYLGSFSSGEGSSADVDTSELHIDGNGRADELTAGCLPTDGGKCRTIRAADFSK